MCPARHELVLLERGAAGRCLGRGEEGREEEGEEEREGGEGSATHCKRGEEGHGSTTRDEEKVRS